METVIGYPTSVLTLFITMVLGMLALDLYIHRKDKIVTLSSAVGWSLFYVAAAFIFAAYLYSTYGAQTSSLFLTGYALEKVLAFDNLFVFSLIFAYFKIPEAQQHKALYWGIAGAIVFRLLFVGLGVSFLNAYGTYVEVAFALIILYTVYIMYDSSDDEAEDYNNTWYAKAIRKVYPSASVLFIAIVTIEISDILFSFDSVPAIIAVTKDPLLIYSAMIFAILGLRSMYHIIASLTRYFVYMDYAVMFVLVLIATKLLLSSLFEIHVEPLQSLLVILGVLGSSIVVSIIKGDTNENAKLN